MNSQMPNIQLHSPSTVSLLKFHINKSLSSVEIFSQIIAFMIMNCNAINIRILLLFQMHTESYFMQIYLQRILFYARIYFRGDIKHRAKRGHVGVKEFSL